MKSSKQAELIAAQEVIIKKVSITTKKKELVNEMMSPQARLLTPHTRNFTQYITEQT
jgi:hypothetical protein